MMLLMACAEPASTVAEVAPPWAEPDAPGPYAAGVTTLFFESEAGKFLVAELWYPAAPTDAPPDPYPELPLSREAHRDVDPDRSGAPYPLVAFSHGYAGIRYQSPFLTEYLAQHGYVVVAVDHVGNTFLDVGDRSELEVLMDRPSDVVASVDEVFARNLDDPQLKGLVEGGRYGMTGHSFGAFTTLAVAGGQVDLDGFVSWCAEHDATFCDSAASLPPGSVLPGSPDPRAVVAVPMSPGGWYGFGEGGSGLSTLAPSLFWAGADDPITTYDEEIHPAWLAAASPKMEATLAGAGHYIFSDICSLAPFFSDECDEGAGWLTTEVGHPPVQALTTAWLDVHLRGDLRAEPWLDPARWASPMSVVAR